MARQRQARLLAGVVVGLVGSALVAPVGAQQTIQKGQAPGPRFMIPIFRSSERNLGAQFSEAARTRMIDDIPSSRTLWIIPKTDIVSTLEASGYSTTEALNSNDTKALAVIIRAAEYVEGTVTKTPTGFRIDATLKLVRGEGMEQPLPPIETNKLDDGAKRLSNAVQAARKQVEHATKCLDMWRAKKYPDAMKEAQAGIAAYADAIMPRVCIAEVLNDQKAAPDSMLKVVEPILKTHPTNKRALAFAADAYNATKQDDKYIDALTTLLAADPTNVRLQTTVVNALAASGNAARAKPIIDDAVKQNPGDPSLIRLQWLIYLTLKDYKGAIAVGEEMAKTDTASADTTYFTRMMAAAVTDSQIPKAAEIAARGVAKFPNNIGLITALAQLQRQSGQTQQSIETLKKVLASDPKAKGVWLQIVRAQMDMNAPTDSIIYSLQQAKAAGDSAALVGAFALTVGNQLYKKAGTDKSLAGFQQALAMLKFADETAPRAEGKFLIGATNLQMAQLLLTEAGDKKSCEMAKQGQSALTDAQINLPAGGQFDPKTAQQLLGYVAQYSPYADQLVKRLCK